MKKIFNFLTPTKILLIFILFIISVVCIYQIDSYKYKQIRAGLIFLYFIPGLFIFIPVLIYNIKKSNKENNLKNKIILIILYFLYIFFMVLYAVICQWLGVENQMG
jgi:cell division protein FtsW (lipid II flippase)